MNERCGISAFSWKAIKAVRPTLIALVSFIAGMLISGRIMHPLSAKADSQRVFELMIYHTLPGKTPALESIFRDVSKLRAKHDIQALGYWVPTGNDPAWNDTFIYVAAHPSREAAEANWKALHSDPAFQPYFKAAAPLIRQDGGDYKVDEIYMRPTDYSSTR